MAEQSNFMVDLETLDTATTAVILSIGAVYFNQVNGLGAEFYQVISVESCEAAGLTTSESTLAWWERQSLQAKEVLTQARNPLEHPEVLPLKEALAAFAKFLAPYKGILMWGNGSDFDNVIIENAYRAIGEKKPWPTYNNRCYRTLKNLVPRIEMQRGGVFHNALDDAKSQAMHAVQILKTLG